MIKQEQEKLRVVGKSSPRITGALEASGLAEYITDIKIPGMLYAKILTSINCPYAHARIKRIDASKAEKLPGVVCVVTHKDVPRVAYSSKALPAAGVYDEYILDDKVRFKGDKVAAVAAVDEDTAEEALELIDVEYEELPAVFDPEEAMKPGAPKIHEAKDQNITIRVRNEWGDIEKGFREADYIFEGRYETSIQAHCAMEPHGCLANYNKITGDITIWSTTQIPFQVLRVVSEVLGIKMSKIRVIKTFTGGGFGGKDEILVEPLCAFLSVKTGRPVKLILTRKEVFVGTRTRHPAVIYLKTGVKKDGTLTARYVKAILNGGAYAGATPGVVGAMSTREIGLYRCENVKFEGFGVYTNTPVAAAFRGYGNPQHNFAVDTHMDEIAEKLGMDPLEFKLKNTIREGDINRGTGIKLESCGLQECMRKGAERIGWAKKRSSASNQKGTRRRGIGMACFMHNSNVYPYGSECSSALVKVNDDGTATAHFGAADMGQGSSTTLAKIAAEELGMSLENINIVTGDTASVPYDPGSYGSRTTFMMGNAVREAARDAKMQIIARASKILNVDPGKLFLENGEIKVRGKDKRISISEVVKRTLYSTKEGGVIVGKSSYSPPSNAPYFGAQFAEVEVDTETGQVDVLRVVAAHDVGKAINPMAVEGQLEGMVSMGMGFALIEEMLLDKSGSTLNADFLDYKLPRARDMPAVDTIIVERREPSGPFGAKGVGEGGVAVTAPAVVNAIYNAIGIRMKKLPVTQDRLLKAIKGGN